MTKIASDIDLLVKNINDLKQASAAYSKQETQLQCVIDELNGVWDSDAGKAFVNSLAKKKRLLELNREIIDDIVKVTEKRYRFLLKMIDQKAFKK